MLTKRLRPVPNTIDKRHPRFIYYRTTLSAIILTGIVNRTAVQRMRLIKIYVFS